MCWSTFKRMGRGGRTGSLRPCDGRQPNDVTTAATEERHMPKGEQRGNREAKKPKKEKPKTIAAAPSMKGTAGSSGGSKK